MHTPTALRLYILSPHLSNTHISLLLSLIFFPSFHSPSPTDTSPLSPPSRIPTLPFFSSPFLLKPPFPFESFLSLSCLAPILPPLCVVPSSAFLPSFSLSFQTVPPSYLSPPVSPTSPLSRRTYKLSSSALTPLQPPSAPDGV